MIWTLVRAAFWLGGLAWAGRQYHVCRDEGILVAGCSNPLEYFAWGTALLGLVMLAHTLTSVPFFKWLAE